jgi:hypothetical protein
MSEIGAGTGSSYPATLDTNSTTEVNSPAGGKTKARAEVPNDLAAAVVAIETELGTDPAGTTTDVKTFLQVEHNTDGTHGDITVDTINTFPLSATPAAGTAVVSDGTGKLAAGWIGIATTKGDVLAHNGTNLVRKAAVEGKSLVSNSAQSDGQLYNYGGTPIVCAVTTSTQALTSASVASITELEMAMAANKNYYFEYSVWSSYATASGSLSFDINGPASPTNVTWDGYIATTDQGSAVPRIKTAYAQAYSMTAGGTRIIIYFARGFIQNGANAGNLQIRADSVAGNTNTIQVGSIGRLWLLN